MLHLLSAGESDPGKFPWLEPPGAEAVAHALQLLDRLGGTHAGVLTAMGRAMARLPVHPRLARMLLEGQRLGQAPRVALAAAISRSAIRSSAAKIKRPTASRRQPVRRARSRRTRWKPTNRRGLARSPSARSTPGPPDFCSGLAINCCGRCGKKRMGRFALSQCPPMTRCGVRLAAYPDRVAVRRQADPSKGLMVGGRGVRLAPWCGVSASELFLCIDVDADPRETLVRQASSIEREWLPLASAVEIFFDDETERLVARKRVSYRG